MKFTQKSWSFGTTEISVKGDTAQVSVKKWFHQYTYDVRLGNLSPKPVITRNFPELFLVHALFFAAFSAVTGVVWYTVPAFAAAAGAWSLLFSAASVLFWGMFIYRYEYNCFFVNKWDGTPSIHIKPDLPDVKTFNQFIDDFSHLLTEYDIQDEWSEEEVPMNIAGEIKRLYHLKQEGILSEAEFSRAKARMLDLDDWEQDL